MSTRDDSAPELVDAALRDEIELVSDLVVAASSAERHLTRAEVDRLLGIRAADDSDKQG